MSEKDNYRHWRDGDRGRREVWYLTWNDPASECGFWLRYIIEQPLEGEPHGELWFARFDPSDPARTFGFHTHVPYSTVAAAEGPFVLSIGGARLGNDHAVGNAKGDGHEVRWDLRWDAGDHTLRFLPDVMYLRGGLGETTVHSPNPRVALSGRLMIDGDLALRFRTDAGRLNLERPHSWRPPDPYHAVWRRYYVTRNYIHWMRRELGHPDLARREAVRALGRAASSWARGPRYGARYSGLVLRGIVDGYRDRLGRTVEPVAKPSE